MAACRWNDDKAKPKNAFANKCGVSTTEKEVEYREPLLFAGVMFLESPADTKIADNKGALLWPKSCVFEAIYMKICG